MSTLHEALRDAMKAKIATMRPFDLTYVAYDDKLSDEQVALVMKGDFPALWESNWEWESDNRRQGARSEYEDLANDVISDWALEDTVKHLVDDGTITDWGEGDFDYDTLKDEFADTSEYDEVMQAIEDHDESDAWKQLAGHTPAHLCNAQVVGEDASWSYNADLTPAEVITDILEWCPGSTLEEDEHNAKAIGYAIANASPEFSYCYGMLVFSVDVETMYGMSDTITHIDVVNPHLWIGNTEYGSGFVTEEPLHGNVRIRRDQLRSDKDVFGYGWDNVCGGVSTGEYAAEIQPLTLEAVES